MLGSPSYPFHLVIAATYNLLFPESYKNLTLLPQYLQNVPVSPTFHVLLHLTVLQEFVQSARNLCLCCYCAMVCAECLPSFWGARSDIWVIDGFVEAFNLNWNFSHAMGILQLPIAICHIKTPAT